MATKLDENDVQIDESELSFKARMQLRIQKSLTSLRYFIYNPANQKILGNTAS